jgi:hypothetical protein
MSTPGEPVPSAELGTSTSTRRFPFAFDGPAGLLCRPFLVTPGDAAVTVSVHQVEARFGPWRVLTPIDNLATVTATGPYRWQLVAGPPRLSRTDHGITFATNATAGVCLTFHQPVAPVLPFPRWRHPGLTVTVADVDGLVALLEQRLAVNRAGGHGPSPAEPAPGAPPLG